VRVNVRDSKDDRRECVVVAEGGFFAVMVGVQLCLLKRCASNAFRHERRYRPGKGITVAVLLLFHTIEQT